jgi:hypothetical protein
VADDNGNGKGGSIDTLAADFRTLTAELKAGKADDVVKRILRDNKKYRERIHALEEQVKGLPPEGSIVLQGKDVERWNALKEMGDPAELKRTLKEADANKTAVEGYRRAELHAKAAQAVGFKAAALDRLIKADGLTVEIQEQRDKDGKAVLVPHVKGEGDKSTPLTDYAEAHWGDLLPSLQVDPDSGSEPAPRAGGTPPARVLRQKAPPPGRNQEKDAYEEARRLPMYNQF